MRETETCPHCGTVLDQLGHMEDDRGRGHIWVPENLYRCMECKYGKNRFTVEHGRLEAYDPRHAEVRNS